MVGCRYNAKNTLVKNYLYFAENSGAEVRPETDVRYISPLPENQPDGARYEIVYRKSQPGLTGAIDGSEPEISCCRQAYWARWVSCSVHAMRPAHCLICHRAWERWFALTAKHSSA